ncbi:MAG: GNAT family N-acetyltransferase [Anaerolineales bacterium]|nr:GNAT family N-acetyltransferase [Anaerolineales bacterium]
MLDQVVVEKIAIPDAPAIPGLSFRGFSGEPDYANILAVIEGSKEADQLERSDSLEDVTRYYSHLNNCDPSKDMLFIEVDEKVVGYTRVEWFVNSDGEWLGFNLAFLLPEWRRKGLGRVMLRFNERRLGEIAAEQIKNGTLGADVRRYFETYADDGETGKQALFHAEGYEAVRYGFDMGRPLSDPVEVTPLPEGIEVRPAQPEHTRAVWEAAEEAFLDHWNSVPGTETDYQRFLTDPTLDPSLWKVGWEGDQVAGSVLNFVNAKENEEYNRKRGYTEGISVRRPWRKLGLATALITRSLKMFQEMGMTEAELAVDAQNLSGALRLYESVGFRQTKQSATYRKELDIVANAQDQQ